MTGTEQDAATAQDSRLSVELQFPPAINYALVHNNVPVARYLRVENLTDEDIPGIDVQIDLLGPDGSMAPTWHRRLPHLHAESEILRDDFADLVPETAALKSNDEAYPVHYQLLVRATGGTRLRAEGRSRVLARNEWFNAPSLYESIAAFVQPNTASVSQVLRDARDLLEHETGSSSLEGYQAGSERAALIGGAIYEALRGQRISYVGLPASFEHTGQKVRTTADVLGDQLGNCLDLAVTYAACLEQAGLHPLIWLVSGHAFAGFFLEEERLPETVSLDPNHMINIIESRRALAVELTGIGPGTGSKTYTEALRAGEAHFRSQDHLHGMVDIALAHRTAIKALPSEDQRSSTDAPETRETTPASALSLPPELASSGAFDTELNLASREDTSDGAPERIKKWRKSLLDLSLRNPLLKLPSRGKGLSLHVPHNALPVLDDLVHRGKHVRIVPEDRVGGVQQASGMHTVRDLPDDGITEELRRDHRIYGGVPERRYVTKMRGLQRDARTIQQETGSNYLYLTFGTLVHPGPSGEAHAPLFLLPVRIEGGSGRSPYTIVADGDEISAPNYCLIEWLRVKHGVRIPELENPILDDDGIDIVRSFEAIRDGLVDNDLHYRLDERASLRLLQFSTFQMWRDLTDHWERFMTNPVVRHLVDRPGHRFADPAGGDDNEFDESSLHLPIPADGSQMRAITMAAKDRSFVLEGPPGTGKSQTITNLIAHALRGGKKVLFVAEKQAALDVVKRRLHEIGLADFCLDLHGRKQSLPSIREQLKTALERTARDDEHGWSAAEARYRQNVRALREYPRQLHTQNAARFSAWSAYAARTAYGDGPVAPVPAEVITLDETRRRAVWTAAAELPAAAESARLRPRHPWSLSSYRTVDGLDGAEVLAAAEELEAVRALFHQLPEQLRAELAGLSSPTFAGTVLPCARLARQGRLPGEQATRAAAGQGWDQAVDGLLTELDEFQQRHAGILATFRPETFAHPDFPAWVTEAENTDKGLFGKKKKRRRLTERLQPHLQEGAGLDPESVRQTVTTASVARDQAAALHQRFLAVPGLELPIDWTPAHPDAITVVQHRRDALVTGRELRADAAGLWQALHGLGMHAPVGELERFVSAWGNWFRLLAPGQDEFRRWAAGRSWPQAWDTDGPVWRDELRTHGLLPLQRWGALVAHTDVLARAGLTDFREQILTGVLPAHELETAYLRGFANTALRERLQAGQLEYFDAEKHEHHVNEYLRLGRELESLLPERLASELLAQRPGLDGGARGGDREFLRHITTARRGANRLSFRQLLAKYPDEITGLTPCFLMSPASVANFLDPAAIEFDLVVFDEASQIRVAQAVGAMGRARSVVVVGDSKQMPPSNIMEASHGDDDDEDAVDTEESVPADLDSILEECVESGLDQQWLSWHYRSSDESLITFSNRNYYEDKLHTLPAPGSSSHAGITWRRLDGTYDRGKTRTNEVEARAIVDQIGALLDDPATAGRSIGVVTFNVQQRDLVLNLLEESADPNIQNALSREDEPLFVKNLENVQGDERDTVLFSLAFSRNPNTGLLPLNFGPLNNAGGERRLNVAITRARQQVMLFSSFDPKDIDLARSNATGIRHLRAYLELAAGGFDQIGGIETQDASPGDRILSEVADAVRARGHEVATNVGLSQFTVDIAVREPGSGQWQVAVLLDSPQWASRLTVADRDGAPQLLGTKMRWPSTVRLWLPAWMQDREAVLERIDNAVAAAADADARVDGQEREDTGTLSGELGSEPDHDPPVDEPVPATSGNAVSDERASGADESGAVAGHAAGSVPAERTTVVNSSNTVVPQQSRGNRLGDSTGPFVPYQPRIVGVKEDLDRLGSDPAVQRQLKEMFTEVADFEGPIEINRLAKKALNCFGLERVRENRLREALDFLPGTLRTKRSPLGEHVWPPSRDPDTWQGFRETQGANDRAVHEIAPEEIINAIRYAWDSGGLGDRLLREALKLLGHTRMTAPVENHVARALEFGIQEGLLPSRLGQR